VLSWPDMPAPVGPLIGIALGAIFAWVVSESVNRKGAPLALAPLALVSLFGLLVFAPIAGYFIAFEPDWAYAYLLDSSRRLGALHTLLLLADVASVPLGFVLVSQSRPGPRGSTLLRLLGGPLLAISLFVVILFPRLAVQATYAQFHGGFGTHPVAGGPLGYAVIWSVLVLAGATTWTAYCLRHLR
jgi:hypothetical protein